MGLCFVFSDIVEKAVCDSFSVVLKLKKKKKCADSLRSCAAVPKLFGLVVRWIIKTQILCEVR